MYNHTPVNPWFSPISGPACPHVHMLWLDGVKSLLMRINVYGKKPRIPPTTQAVQCSITWMFTWCVLSRAHFHLWERLQPCPFPQSGLQTNCCSLMNMHVLLAHAPLVFKFQDQALNLCGWIPDWTELWGRTWAELQSEYLHIIIEFRLKHDRFIKLLLLKPVYNIHCLFNKDIQQRNMESLGEMIPFAKEMLNQRPSKHMLKIYMLGSSLALLGLVGGLVETLLMPFVEQQMVTEPPAWFMGENQQRWNPELSHVAVLDMHTPLDIMVASTHLPAGQRNSANRLHAS